MSETKTVVVGVDASPAGHGAVWWAAREATLRGCRLLIVHSLSATTPWLDQAREVTADALGYARHLAPDLRVDAVVAEHPAGRELCEQSRSAALVVVGSRGLGGFTGLLLGSVSGYVATHAHCPVLVVHDAQNWAGPDVVDTSGRPVVVGVGSDGEHSGEHEATLDFAWQEAALRGVELVAVRGWRPPPPPWRSDVRPLVADVSELEAAERRDLADLVDRWREKYPGVRVRQRLLPVGAAAAVVDAAAHAQVVVVGARGHGAEAFAVGSVAHQVLLHAPGPVIVVRPAQ